MQTQSGGNAIEIDATAAVTSVGMTTLSPAFVSELAAVAVSTRVVYSDPSPFRLVSDSAMVSYSHLHRK